MGWVGTIKEIWEKNNKANNNKLSKGMVNDKLSNAEYDRMVVFHSGLHGKPIIGASVIHNASYEEKKDLVLAILPWIMPGGSLRLTMLSGGALGLLDGVISEDKPSDIIRKMAIGSTFGFIGHLGFNLLSKGTKVKSFLKAGRNSEDKVLKQKKVNSQIVYGEKEFLEEMAKYPRVKIDNKIKELIINMPKDKRWDPSAYIPNVDLSKKVEDGLISTPNGNRPLPKRYLSKKEIDEHLKLFENGVVKIVSQESFSRTLKYYSGYIGPESGQFVMPKFVYEKAVKASNGNPRVLEELLGFDKGYLGKNPISIEAKRLEYLKFPSGNEDGAYQGLWEPGGRTKGGIPEAVINQLAPGDYITKNVYEGVFK